MRSFGYWSSKGTETTNCENRTQQHFPGKETAHLYLLLEISLLAQEAGASLSPSPLIEL